MASSSGAKNLPDPPDIGRTVSGELVGGDSDGSDDSGGGGGYDELDMSREDRAQRLRDGILIKDRTLVGDSSPGRGSPLVGSPGKGHDAFSRTGSGELSPGRTSPGRKAQETQAEYAERGKHAAQIRQQKVQAKVTMHDFKNQEVFVRTKAGETTTGKIKLNLPLKQQEQAARPIKVSVKSAVTKEKGDNGHHEASSLKVMEEKAVTKPGMRFKVIKRKAQVSGKTWAWWDSIDGRSGGKQIRFASQPEDTDAIRAFELFPPGPFECSILLDDRKTNVDCRYDAIAPCHADSDGAAGFIMTCVAGTWPIDADSIMPSFERQLNRNRIERDYVDKRNESSALEHIMSEAQGRAKARVDDERRRENQDKLKHMLASSRKPAPAAVVGKAPLGEYAVWSIVQAGGVPPPPEKHPLVNVHSYIKKLQIAGPIKKANEDELNLEVRSMLANQRVYAEGKIRTLEIWSHDFTVRYNLNLSIIDAFTGNPVDPKGLREELLIWTHTRVFKKSMQRASRYGMKKKENAAAESEEYHPQLRDAPSVCYDTTGRLWLFGGKSKGGAYKNYFGDLWVFDYATNLWKNYPRAEHKTKGKTAATLATTKTVNKPPGADGEAGGVGGGGGDGEDVKKVHAPTEMSGKIPGPRSSAMSVIKDGYYYIAGGMTATGKIKDVYRLDLETMVWNELVPAGSIKTNELEVLEIETEGDYPPRGFAMKNLVLPSSLYGAFLSENCMHELCLNSLKWKRIRTQNLLCWDTTKVLCTEDGPMLRITGVDFGASKNPSGAYPAIETAAAWRSYGNCEDNDVRDDPPQAWQLYPGQSLKFSSIPSVGDEPGKWTVHGISKGVVNGLDRDDAELAKRQEKHGGGMPAERMRTSYYIFGGVREGGTPKKSSYVDLEDEYVIGLHIIARIGQPVVLRKGTSVSQNLPRSRAATSTYSDADSKWTAPLPDNASTVQGDRFRVQTGGIASEVDTMSKMNMDGTTTRGGTAATRGAGGRTGGTARASTAASYARTKSGDLKTGIIVWVDEGGGPDPATKLKVVKVLWDDEDEAKERERVLAKLRRERDSQRENEKDNGDDDEKGPGVEGVESYSSDPLATVKKYSIGFNGRYDLAAYVQTELYGMAQHICNDVFEVSIVESSSQGKTVENIRKWKSNQGGVDGAALRVLLKDKLSMADGEAHEMSLAEKRKMMEKQLLGPVKLKPGETGLAATDRAGANLKHSDLISMQQGGGDSARSGSSGSGSSRSGSASVYSGSASSRSAASSKTSNRSGPNR